MAGWTNLRGNLRKLSKSLQFVSARNPGSKLTFDTVMSEGKNATTVLFGEQHHQPSILKAQLCVLERMVSQTIEQSHGAFPVTFVLEMFNLHQQPLLDAYQANEISLEE